MPIIPLQKIEGDTDLCYLRNQIANELQNLKDILDQAFATEQTVQQLSAENLKLREDLNNELTRKNILFEIKRSTGGDAPSSGKEAGVCSCQQEFHSCKLA